MSRKNNINNIPDNNYARFSGMAFRMLGIIFLGVWGGKSLDEKFTSSDFPIWTIVLSLIAVFISLYVIIRDVIKQSHK